MKMKVSYVIGVFIGACIVSYLSTILLVWGLCTLLPILGITTIGAWTIAFNWKMASLVWVILFGLKNMFYTRKKEG